jgi:hypothetical protein
MITTYLVMFFVGLVGLTIASFFVTKSWPVRIILWVVSAGLIMYSGWVLQGV